MKQRWVMFAAILVLFFGVATLQSGSAGRAFGQNAGAAKQGKLPSENTADDQVARISGQLRTVNGQAAGKRRVLLTPARLVNLQNEEVANLPPQGLVVIDAAFTKADATVQTDATGHFEFKDIKPGRYLLGVAVGPGVEDVIGTLIFDAAPGKKLDLGPLSPNKGDKVRFRW